MRLPFSRFNIILWMANVILSGPTSDLSFSSQVTIRNKYAPYIYSNYGAGVIGSGILITPNAVLTSQNVIMNKLVAYKLSPINTDELTVVNEKETPAAHIITQYFVVKIVYNNHFDEINLISNNIALLKLDQRITEGLSLTPTGLFFSLLFTVERCELYFWGAGRYSGLLKSSTEIIYSRSVNSSLEKGILSSNLSIVLFPIDSGGAVICNGSLAGIIPWSGNSQTGYTYLTEIYEFSYWISEQTSFWLENNRGSTTLYSNKLDRLICLIGILYLLLIK
ncbi:hypothetical protein ACFFRR_001365 [Megaselia abdita]